ncbi:MAG: SH3 domain-containing protein [Desulfomonilia bacterium]
MNDLVSMVWKSVPGNRKSRRVPGRSPWAAVVLLVLLSACAPKELLYYASPVLVPGTVREMNTPGFWIHRHPEPDQVIMTPGEIGQFNAITREETGVVREICLFPMEKNGKDLKEGLRSIVTSLAEKTFFTREAQKAGQKFFDPILFAMDLEHIPSTITIRYALVTSFTNQRVLPTDQGLFSRKGRVDFDRLQNSALDIGTPLAVLHTSADGQWYYGVSPLSEGWIRSEHAAVCTVDQLEHFLHAEPFAVSIRPKTDIYLDPAMTQHYGSLRMGVRMPRYGYMYPGVVEVLLPQRMEDGMLTFSGGYIPADKVSDGYLPFTPRTMIEQAFGMLNAPYGWGGMYGEQDCSRYIQQVFATCGIMLPRNSAQQAKVGRLIAEFSGETGSVERIEALSRAPGGVTILYMPGHIMLLLGIFNGEPFAIHDIWAYSEPTGTTERLRVVNRVAVTSLSLGEDAENGSLLHRLVSVRSLDRKPVVK